MSTESASEIVPCIVCGVPFRRKHELEQTCGEGCQREKDEADAEAYEEIMK